MFRLSLLNWWTCPVGACELNQNIHIVHSENEDNDNVRILYAQTVDIVLLYTKTETHKCYLNFVSSHYFFNKKSFSPCFQQKAKVRASVKLKEELNNIMSTLKCNNLSFVILWKRKTKTTQGDTISIVTTTKCKRCGWWNKIINMVFTRKKYIFVSGSLDRIHPTPKTSLMKTCFYNIPYILNRTKHKLV